MIPFWRDPNNDIEILEANDDEQEKYGHRYGSDTIVLSPEHIQALQAGKMLAWNDGEYSTFVVLASGEARAGVIVQHDEEDVSIRIPNIFATIPVLRRFTAMTIGQQGNDLVITFET